MQKKQGEEEPGKDQDKGAPIIRPVQAVFHQHETKGPPGKGPLPKPVGKLSVALFVSICPPTVCRTSFCIRQPRALGPCGTLLP